MWNYTLPMKNTSDLRIYIYMMHLMFEISGSVDPHVMEVDWSHPAWSLSSGIKLLYLREYSFRTSIHTQLYRQIVGLCCRRLPGRIWIAKCKPSELMCKIIEGPASHIHRYSQYRIDAVNVKAQNGSRKQVNSRRTHPREQLYISASINCLCRVGKDGPSGRGGTSPLGLRSNTQGQNSISGTQCFRLCTSRSVSIIARSVPARLLSPSPASYYAHM